RYLGCYQNHKYEKTHHHDLLDGLGHGGNRSGNSQPGKYWTRHAVSYQFRGGWRHGWEYVACTRWFLLRSHHRSLNDDLRRRLSSGSLVRDMVGYLAPD